MAVYTRYTPDLPAPSRARARFPRRAYTTDQVRSGQVGLLYIKYYGIRRNGNMRCTGRALSYYSRGRPCITFLSAAAFPENRNSHDNERNANNTVRNVPVGRGPRRTGHEIYCRCNPPSTVCHASLCKNLLFLLLLGRPRYKDT